MFGQHVILKVKENDSSGKKKESDRYIKNLLQGNVSYNVLPWDGKSRGYETAK